MRESNELLERATAKRQEKTPKASIESLMLKTAHQNFVETTPIEGVSIYAVDCLERSRLIKANEIGQQNITAKRIRIKDSPSEGLAREIDL